MAAGGCRRQWRRAFIDRYPLESQDDLALYGQSPSDYFVEKLFDVGAVSKLSSFVALGVAFWLSRQGIYMFDGATLTYLSKPIKLILDTFSEADFAACTGCFDDRIAWFSFPTQGISLGYDTVGAAVVESRHHPQRLRFRHRSAEPSSSGRLGLRCRR